jgi:transposase
MLADGYAPVQIKELLHTTYNRIRRYATGVPEALCRFQGNRDSEVDQYKDTIVELLRQNTLKKHILEHIAALGYRGKRTALEFYCRKRIVELGIPYRPRRNAAGMQIYPNLAKPVEHFVSASDFARHLWSGKELEPADIDYIISKYPRIPEIQQCIQDFRKIYGDKDIALLDQFIERYSNRPIKPIKSFASGLRGDREAIKNSVASELSNGFVEGNNNKIKAIKRTMYGRAKIDLLRVKVLYAR